MSRKILLVDDEAGIRKVLSVSLADLGYDVRTAADGIGALSEFAEFSPPIVITDIKMPGMDGIELLKRIKAQSPETEVIMITGHGDMDLAINSLKHDATDFIAKPVDDVSLITAIEKAEENIEFRSRLKAYTDRLSDLLKEKDQKLKEVGDWAAVGQVSAELAHTIKNIISGLKGGTYVIEKGLELDNRKYLEQGWDMVKNNVAKITGLSLGLLDYARAGKIECRPCDPNQPAGEVYRLMKERAEASGIDFRLRPSEGVGGICMDADAVQRCLLNLVSNAVDACREGAKGGGRCSIDLAVRKIEGWGVEYRVADTCGGIDEALQENIFTGFFSTKGSGGTGIGLMMTKRIVDEHGGEISFTTAPGSGTTFIIRLPEKAL